eukprot:scaffold1686_cov99-Isochrysis_galbana.AAC.1
MCYTFQGLARAPHRYPVRARPVRARKAVATHHRSFTRRAAGVQSFIVAANLRWQNTQEFVLHLGPPTPPICYTKPRPHPTPRAVSGVQGGKVKLGSG